MKKLTIRLLGLLLAALLLSGCVAKRADDTIPTTIVEETGETESVRTTVEATEAIPTETEKPCEHDWIVDPNKPHTATCTGDGEEFFICTLCKETKAEPKPAHGHYWVRQKYISGDCSTGITYLERCGNCYVERQHTWKAGEHDYDRENPGRVQQPTCTEDGFRYVYCTGCGARLKETLPAAHTPGADGICTGCGTQCPLPTDPTEPTE